MGMVVARRFLVGAQGSGRPLLKDTSARDLHTGAAAARSFGRLIADHLALVGDLLDSLPIGGLAGVGRITWDIRDAPTSALRAPASPDSSAAALIPWGRGIRSWLADWNLGPGVRLTLEFVPILRSLPLR